MGMGKALTWAVGGRSSPANPTHPVSLHGRSAWHQQQPLATGSVSQLAQASTATASTAGQLWGSSVSAAFLVDLRRLLRRRWTSQSGKSHLPSMSAGSLPETLRAAVALVIPPPKTVSKPQTIAPWHFRIRACAAASLLLNCLAHVIIDALKNAHARGFHHSRAREPSRTLIAAK